MRIQLFGANWKLKWQLKLNISLFVAALHEVVTCLGRVPPLTQF